MQDPESMSNLLLDLHMCDSIPLSGRTWCPAFGNMLSADDPFCGKGCATTDACQWDPLALLYSEAPDGSLSRRMLKRFLQSLPKVPPWGCRMVILLFGVCVETLT